MRGLFLYFCGMLASISIWAQDQMTNSGNLNFHLGSTVGVFGSFANNGTVVDSATQLGFYGSSQQILSGSSVTTFKNPLLNNASGLLLQQSAIVSGSLSLSTGSLALNSRTLTISNTSASAISRSSGYIVSEQTDNSSTLAWRIANTTSPHIIPFGNTAGSYIPFGVTVTTGTVGHVYVSTYGTGASNLPLPTTPDVVGHVNNLSGTNNSAQTVDRFWQLKKDSSGGILTIVFTAAASEVGSITGLTAQRWNTVGGGWDPPLATQLSSANSVTVTGVTLFSPWTLVAGLSLLPIELLDFDAMLNGNQVDLRWVTVTELNNDYFTIERSRDGNTFEEIGTVKGAGNSNTTRHYTAVDPRPYEGISYYRLRQTDFDGSFTYTDMKYVERYGADGRTVNVFPNPASENVSIALNGFIDQRVWLELKDNTGRVRWQQELQVQQTYQELHIPRGPELNAGIYLLTLSTGDAHYVNKISLE